MLNRRAGHLVIVEDDELQRSALKTLFETHTHLTVSAFPSGESLLSSGTALPPEVMLVELHLAGMSGIELIERAKERWPELEIVVHTTCEDRGSVLGALAAGASGYLLKATRSEELVDGIRAVREGGAPITPKIARTILRELKRENMIDAQHLLSSREKEILGCMAEGGAYKEIAGALNLSVHTIHTHVKKIYQKLGVCNKRDAIASAKKRGIL